MWVAWQWRGRSYKRDLARAWRSCAHTMAELSKDTLQPLALVTNALVPIVNGLKQQYAIKVPELQKHKEQQAKVVAEQQAALESKKAELQAAAELKRKCEEELAAASAKHARLDGVVQQHQNVLGHGVAELQKRENALRQYIEANKAFSGMLPHKSKQQRLWVGSLRLLPDPCATRMCSRIRFCMHPPCVCVGAGAAASKELTIEDVATLNHLVMQLFGSAPATAAAMKAAEHDQMAAADAVASAASPETPSAAVPAATPVADASRQMRPAAVNASKSLARSPLHAHTLAAMSHTTTRTHVTLPDCVPCDALALASQTTAWRCSRTLRTCATTTWPPTTRCCSRAR